MTTGALIFAYNNEHIDYVAMAQWSAQNIERHLGIPTTIITDHNVQGINTRHFGDVVLVRMIKHWCWTQTMLLPVTNYKQC
jgi:hypothetical protein